jgi:hypothetical protein
VGIMSHALRSGGAGAERPKNHGDRMGSSSAGGVFRGSRRTCAERARWRLVRGQPSQRLSAHYQLECDYGTSILAVYNEGDPVFLCESHVSAITPRDSCIAGVRPIKPGEEIALTPRTCGEELEAVQLDLIAAAVAGAAEPVALADAEQKASKPAQAPTSEADTPQQTASRTSERFSLADRTATKQSDAEIAASTGGNAAPAPETANLAGTGSAAAAEGAAGNGSSRSGTQYSGAQNSARSKGRRIGNDPIASARKTVARDFSYGNPAKALVDETIWNMAPGDLDAYRHALEQGKSPLEAAQSAGGQLAVVHRKIAEYSAKIEPILSGSQATISVGYAIDKPLEQAVLDIIASNALVDAEKDAAVEHLGAFQQSIKSGLGPVMSPLQAHRIARNIGERANWGGESEFCEELKQAYRAVFARLRDALRAFVPEARELDERLANLYAAKSELESTPAKASHSATA